MHVIAIKPVFASLRGLCERGDVVPPGNPPATILSGSEVTMSPGLQWLSSRHTHRTPSSTYLHASLSSFACCWHAGITGCGLWRLVCGSLTHCPLLDRAHVLYISATSHGSLGFHARHLAHSSGQVQLSVSVSY